MPPHRHQTYSTIIDGYEVTAVQQSYGLRTIRTNPVIDNTDDLRVIHLTPSMWEFVVSSLSGAADSAAVLGSLLTKMLQVIEEFGWPDLTADEYALLQKVTGLYH